MGWQWSAQGQCSGCEYGISPLGRGHQWAHHGIARTCIGLGNRLLEGTTEPRAPGPRRKEQWLHRRLDCGCPGASNGGMAQWWPAKGLGARTIAVPAWDLLRVGIIILITSTIVWPQVNSRGGTQLHPTTENWIKDLLSMALPIRTRPSYPLSQYIPKGSSHKPLIFFYQRADRLKTTITEKLSL